MKIWLNVQMCSTQESVVSFLHRSRRSQFFKAKYLSIRPPLRVRTTTVVFGERVNFAVSKTCAKLPDLTEVFAEKKRQLNEDHRRTVLQAVRLGARATVLPKYLCSPKNRLCHKKKRGV
jgi:hypothetical protein